ncbi:MAG TPA: hypothetical protein VND19_02755 [Acetobacteraceae bacterium]|nr:hypothetical protein [Acetobacteraceae bacterium]
MSVTGMVNLAWPQRERRPVAHQPRRAGRRTGEHVTCTGGAIDHVLGLGHLQWRHCRGPRQGHVLPSEMLQPEGTKHRARMQRGDPFTRVASGLDLSRA